jgi:hypothetical protein
MSNIVIEQAASAYLKMDKQAKYRPGAPSDGFGNITGHGNLHKEAYVYGEQWDKSEETFEYFIGCGDSQTREALIFTVEAAKNLCAGRLGDHVALKLLKMAVRELEKTIMDTDNKRIYEALGVGRT